MTLYIIYHTMLFPYLPPPPTRFQNTHTIRYLTYPTFKNRNKEYWSQLLTKKLPTKFRDNTWNIVQTMEDRQTWNGNREAFLPHPPLIK